MTSTPPYTPPDHCQTVQQLFIEVQLRESLYCQEQLRQEPKPDVLTASLQATRILLNLLIERKGEANSAGYHQVETLMGQLHLPHTYRTDLTFGIKRVLCEADAPSRFAVGFRTDEARLFDPRSAAALEEVIAFVENAEHNRYSHLFVIKPSMVHLHLTYIITPVTLEELRSWLASQIDPEPYRIAKERLEHIWRWNEEHPFRLSVPTSTLITLAGTVERSYSSLLAAIQAYAPVEEMR